ncbi:MAG: transcriptional regulator [Desulfobulbus propionicus]|nr:MAG: transcriptional regulator [Desulfobulbus propionicus]
MNKRVCIESNILFQGLSSEMLSQIEGISRMKRVERGEMIFFDGDACDGFYIVVTGKVKIFKTSLHGKEQILHIFGQGQPFGEVPVFHGKPFPASAQALAAGEVLFFPRKDFIALLTNNPSIALAMLAVLSMRLRKFTTQIENLSLKEVPERLAAYLLVLFEEQGHSATVELEISKGQLASLLGTTPETLSRIFHKMTDEGLITVTGKQITLLDRNRLIER